MLRSDLCDYPDAYIVVKGTTTLKKWRIEISTIEILF